MRKLLLFCLIFTCLFTFGKCKNKKKCCKKKTTTTAAAAVTSPINSRDPNNMWLGYDETQCANPWQFNWFVAPTDEQLAGAVRGHLQGQGFTILDMRTARDKDKVNCEGCTCLNGFHYYVYVPKAEADKLKAMKFHEVETVPAGESPNIR